jgi:predicted alpha/beta hydrolase
MSEVLAQDTTIAARDGLALGASVYAPETAPRGAVLINSATAVPRKIYRGFAGYLAQQGFAVLSYDYRGTGGSRPASLRGFSARMRDWAALDVAAAIDHMRTVWPKLPLAVVGHSFGGQAVGLVPNNSEISRVLLIAAQAGHWGLIQSPEKYRVYVLMRLIGSPVARALGYMPGRLGIGEDLPRDVFLEWTGWVMRRRYFFDDATLEALENFPRYRGALRAMCMTDDPWATPAAVDLLCSGFTGTAAERIDVQPRAVGAARIGHFGFFRSEHRDTLWRDAANWLAGDELANTAPSSSGRA